MKLLQFNITSLNTSLKELWGYLKENNYDAKFQQETNYTAGKSLAYFKYWNTKMFTNIDLTLTCGLKNITVVTKDFTLIKTRHKTTEILIEQEPSFKPNPNFRTKNVDWEKWKQFLQAPLEEYSTNFPLEISEKVLDQHANKLAELIVGSATSFFLDLTEISNKRAKG